MKSVFLSLLLISSSCFADLNLFQTAEPKISVQNSILAKVNGNTISVIDVMKKMDLILHQNYPQYANAAQARFQFYAASWRPVFMEMIDTELMLADAEEKEIKLTDGDVREEMESRFGPSILVTLDKIGLSYDDAWKIVRKELIVRRMMWFFVQSKAIQSVSPQEIRQAYRNHLLEHPPYQECKYRVITLNQAEQDARDIHELLASNQSLEEAIPLLKQKNLQVSNEFTAKDYELSDAHRTALAPLSAGSYSEPTAQKSRDGKTVHRIFYLAEKNEFPSVTFDEIANRLKNELVQKAMIKESDTYLKKLRKHYGFDPNYLRETVPDDLQPFSLE